MKCQNCGEHEANFRYTEIINGDKKELNLCEECANKLGLQKLDFNIPINFSSFFGDFLNEYEDLNYMPMLTRPTELKCKDCQMTYNEFMNTGKFGCANCYNVFASKIDPVLNRLHGSTKYLGRKAKINRDEIGSNVVGTIKEKEQTEVDKLKEQLKQAIKEENYEQAAKLRDEIKKLEK